MGGYVTVMPARDFDKWLADGGNERKPVTETLAQRGETIWKEKMCGSCHGVEDTAQGPSLLGVAGSVRKMSNGEQVLVNAEYMRESIVDPAKRILAGYTETMPQDYKNYFNEEQMLSLISYMQTLGVQKQPEPAKAVPATRGNR